MSKYIFRVLAATFLLAWCLYITSFIGAPPSTKPLDWNGAWSFIAMLAQAMMLGWFAQKETEDSK